MRDGVHDFDADATNKGGDMRKFEGSGLKAGVEDGLSFVEALTRNAVESQQETVGNTFKPHREDESGGSKRGKNFIIK